MYKFILIFIFTLLINAKFVLSQGIINYGASIVITPGANLILKDANANFMNVAGNWTNNGTFNHNNGKVTFNGNITHSGSTTTTTFNNVVYDIQGKEIISKNLESNSLNQIEMNNADGVYLVKIFTDNNSYSKKIYINK